MNSLNKKYNRLIKEKSPYLQQHAKNPVNWYPWSQEAFSKAKKENKPIFLSIGYSTCHWCHVMAHESFEDEEVAQQLNNTFICIKVDREERPDIDKIYMNTSTLITGTGGWPLTIIMTPEKKPFFAATYLPKHTRFGIKGLLTLIPEIKNLWQNKQKEIQNSANQITTILQKTNQTKTQQTLTQQTLDLAYEQLFNTFDEQYGGFGNQPKFPTPHQLLFLLRYWKKTKKAYAMKMVETTLEQIQQGGIHDHIGYGFHRYSTDKKWILPHFEKMLYDQAQLIIAYTETYQATKKQIYRKTAEEIINFILRDLTSKEGGFYSAIDADSEGVEGKYYTWKYEELKKHLTNEELELISKFYNIKPEGNFTAETGHTTHQNIFYQTTTLEDYAKIHQIKEKELQNKLEKIRTKLFKIRNQRIHPEKDNKILTDWNGLTIAALAEAAQAFNNKNYAEYAEKALNFILKNMKQSSGGLLHRYRKGEVIIQGFADDYVFLIYGTIELYQATFNPKHLQTALELNKYLLQHFWDKDHGGLYFTSDTNEKLIARTKEIYDGALPSANSIIMYNLIRLARITGNTELEEKAIEIGKTFTNQINQAPSGYTQMMTGLDFALGPSYEIVVVGNKDKQDTQKIIQNIHSMYLPKKVVILKEPDSKDKLTEKLVPLIKEYTQIKNQTTVFVCKNQICQQPTTDIEKMIKLLN